MLKITIYSERHCDECNDFIHNHMDCPACGLEYAGTDAYGTDLNDHAGDCTLKCEECGARFHTAGQHPYDEDAEQWEQLAGVGT